MLDSWNESKAKSVIIDSSIISKGANVDIFRQSLNPSRRLAMMIVTTLIAGGITACATMESVPRAEPEKLVADARTTLSNFMRDPDQTWIQQNLNRARGVLIAPQIRHLRKSIEKLAMAAGKPVALIEPFHYATMNGQAVLEQVLYLLATTQEGKLET